MNRSDSRATATDPTATAAQAAEETRFPLDLPGYTGSLEELVREAQRGQIDLAEISVGAITAAFRERMRTEGEALPLRDVADFLTLVARLVALKASAVGSADEQRLDTLEDDLGDEGDAGRRLAEYRLFKAAAEALLSEAADEGARSFLGIVSPEVIPVERMRIPPERLAAAFRAVLERLAQAEPIPVGTVTFSVEEKVETLRRLLASGPLDFEELFAGVASRLEAVACFLGLLELLKRGEATVQQDEPFGPIRVTGGG